MELPESLKKWSDDELVALNKAIVAEIKRRRAERTRDEMARFRIGDMVSFATREGDLIEGTVIKINKKSVGLQTREGTQWRVHPSLLSRVGEGRNVTPAQPVIDLDEFEFED